jgi:SpoVK/Ycf46/Vps4 family AAA+-type ATPase
MDKEREYLKLFNGKLENDITDKTKTYAREKYREFFYVFNNLEDYEKWYKYCKDRIEYIFYDGIHVYSQEEVNDKIDKRNKERQYYY